jgi:hypothetical protein
MSQVAHTQPQVLRFRLPLRAWLMAVALIAGAAIALFFALSAEEATDPAKPAASASVAGVRYDGGPEEGTRGLLYSGSAAAGVRFDGGPEEGGHGIRHSSTVAAPPAGTRYDGGPEEGSRVVPSSDSSSTTAGVRFDGGPEEGTHGLGR